jgi:hypothetical protein
MRASTAMPAVAAGDSRAAELRPAESHPPRDSESWSIRPRVAGPRLDTADCRAAIRHGPIRGPRLVLAAVWAILSGIRTPAAGIDWIPGPGRLAPPGVTRAA